MASGREENMEVAVRLWELSLAMEIMGERFRAASYHKAAQSLNRLAEPLRSISERGELRKIEGVGESIAAKIDEYLASGRIEALEGLRDALPEDLPLFRDAPALGVVRIGKLVNELGVRSVVSLLRALEEGAMAAIPELGEEVERRTMEWLAWKRGEAAEVPAPYAFRSAERIIAHLRGGGSVQDIVLTGPIRRKVSTVANITLLFTSERPDLVIAHFGTCPEVTELTMVERGVAVGRTASGVGCMLRQVSEDELVWELFRCTGPDLHVREVLSRFEGASVENEGIGQWAVREEADIYSRAGTAYVPPEQREGRTITGGSLLTTNELQGDLHVRSILMDGSIVVEEQAEAAIVTGHRYICLCDPPLDRHGRDALFSRRNELIDEVNERKSVLVLKGAEVGITPDGRLDAPASLLEGLDLVIASVNTKLGWGREETTNRILKAMDDTNMDVVGHPTGRVIGLRERVAVDLGAVAEGAAERRVAIEMNAHPDLQDIDDNDAYRLYESGAYYSLGTGTILPPLGGRWDWAVTMARRAQLRSERLLNSRPGRELLGRAWRR